MKPELQQKLINKYPKIFAELLNKPEKSDIIKPIYFGIECGDGWYWLLDNLLSSIQKYIDNNKVDQVVATQIKEKFGSLRFYYVGGDSLIEGMAWLATDLSEGICEECGTTHHVGQTQNKWIYTRCERCIKQIPDYESYNWKENELA